MDILFIGGIFKKEQQQEILNRSKSVVQFAANVLQWNLITGLDACNNKNITILSALFIGSYPSLYKGVLIKPEKWSHAAEATDINVGFVNIFGIKHLWRAVALEKQAVKWAKTASAEKKVIIVYSMHTPFIYAAAKAKLLNPDIHVCLVAPDLPQFMNLGKPSGKIFSILKSIDLHVMDRYLKYVDSFVLLTKYMAGAIGLGNRPWIVVEGVVNPDDIPEPSKVIESSDKKVILYTGTLNKAYGILELIEAFKLIKDNDIQLEICGAGEAEPEVRALEAMNSRVKYFGQVTRDKAIELQRKANVLINPRSGSDEFTKYSFPSKIMEYMLSGTPAIVKKLPGIPDEYMNYLFVVNGDNINDLAVKIHEVCKKSKEDLRIFGLNARNFVISQKNHKTQASKILEMIKTNLKSS